MYQLGRIQVDMSELAQELGLELAQELGLESEQE